VDYLARSYHHGLPKVNSRCWRHFSHFSWNPKKFYWYSYDSYCRYSSKIQVSNTLPVTWYCSTWCYKSFSFLLLVVDFFTVYGITNVFLFPMYLVLPVLGYIVLYWSTPVQYILLGSTGTSSSLLLQFCSTPFILLPQNSSKIVLLPNRNFKESPLQYFRNEGKY
jgi:hypothetical protein